MKNIKIIVLLFVLLGCNSVLAQKSRKTQKPKSKSAQNIPTVKGYLCGSEEGNQAGTIGLRVGTKIVQVAHTFNVSPGIYAEVTKGMSKRQADKFIRENMTKYINFDLPFGDGSIGSEFIVRYKRSKVDNGGFYNWAVSITSTGKSKKTKPCSVD